METTVNPPIFVQIGNQIINAVHILHIADCGLVSAYKPEWATKRGQWVELYGDGRTDQPVQEVRKINISYNDGSEYSISYYAEEAEALWQFFTGAAVQLLTLDSES